MTAFWTPTQLSDHFNSTEFDSADGSLPTLVEGVLIARLEALRAAAGGRPLRILSGYRSQRHNQTVGGARWSRHVVGDAADLYDGAATVAQAEAVGFTGIGRRGKWAVHVDCRPTPSRWSY